MHLHPQEPRKMPQTCQSLKGTPFFKLVHCMTRLSHCLLGKRQREHATWQHITRGCYKICGLIGVSRSQSTGSCSWNYYLMGAPQHTLDHMENTLPCLGGSQLKIPWPVNQPWVGNLDYCYVHETEDKKPEGNSWSFHRVKRKCSFMSCSPTT